VNQVAVRVRVRIKSLRSSGEVYTSALVNSGFEADTPQLLVPRRLAIELGLWPPPGDAYLIEVGTAGGLLETTLYQELLRSMLLHVIESWDLLSPTS